MYKRRYFYSIFIYSETSVYIPFNGMKKEMVVFHFMWKNLFIHSDNTYQIGRLFFSFFFSFILLFLYENLFVNLSLSSSAMRQLLPLFFPLQFFVIEIRIIDSASINMENVRFDFANRRNSFPFNIEIENSMKKKEIFTQIEGGMGVKTYPLYVQSII